MNYYYGMMDIIYNKDLFSEIIKYLSYYEIIALFRTNHKMRGIITSHPILKQLINKHDANHEMITKNLGYEYDETYYIDLCKSLHVFNHVHARYLNYKTDKILYIPRANFRNMSLLILSKNLQADVIYTNKLKILYLSNCNLTCMPRIMSDNLEELHLNNNNITHIPSDYNFRNIKSLHIQKNRLSYLPDIKNNLQYLYINGNNIDYSNIPNSYYGIVIINDL